jgi:hypothetical protein
MDRQQLLDNAYRHFSKPGAQRGHDGAVCVYNGSKLVPDGAGGQTRVTVSCAIGCQIPPYLYVEGMEGMSASDLTSKFPEVERHFRIETREDEEFLDNLQEMHDSAKDVPEVLANFVNLAAREGLEDPRSR